MIWELVILERPNRRRGSVLTVERREAGSVTRNRLRRANQVCRPAKSRSAGASDSTELSQQGAAGRCDDQGLWSFYAPALLQLE